MESRTIYFTIRVDVTLPDGYEDLTTGDIANNIKSLDIQLNETNPIVLDDVTISDINDEC